MLVGRAAAYHIPTFFYHESLLFGKFWESRKTGLLLASSFFQFPAALSPETRKLNWNACLPQNFQCHYPPISQTERERERRRKLPYNNKYISYFYVEMLVARERKWNEGKREKVEIYLYFFIKIYKEKGKEKTDDVVLLADFSASEKLQTHLYYIFFFY